MKRLFCFAGILCAAISWGGSLSVTGSGAHAVVDGAKPHVSSSSESVFFTDWGSSTYTLTVSPGSSYVFIPEETKISSGEPNGTNSVKKTITDTAANPESFTLGMYGKMYKPGGTGGSPIDWSASIGTKFFHIQSNQSGGAKNITVPVGTSVTYTAREGTSSVAADWQVTGAPPKNNESSIIFSRSWWDVPGWYDASMGTPKPDIYSIYASPTGTSSPHDTGTMNVVGVKSISGGGKISTKSSENDLTDTETILVDASITQSVSLTASHEPSNGVQWPSEMPEWTASCGPLCVLGDHFIGDPDGQSVAEVDTSSPDIIVVSAECGTSKKYIKVKIYEVELECPSAILRDGQSGNNNNTIKVKSELGRNYTLKIERTSGSAGAAEFSSQASTLSYTGKGFESWDEIFVNGLQESDTASNIKISVNYNNQEVANDSTIVYSQVINTFTNGKLQRKDTDEQCDACQNSGQLLYLGHYTKGEHEEDSDCMYCNHCRAYCANACLATIKGNSQDSYRKLRTSNVTQNHDKGMTTDDISAYMTPFIFNYETIYQLAKQNTNMLAGFNNHGYIIYGAEKNTPAGDINNGMIYTWEPGWGDMETYGISVILYCFR